MQPKTEEFLYFLLWSMDQMGRPTFRKLTDSYENWAYRKGLLRQTAKLKQQKLLECESEISKDRLYRLTEQGRLHALGGRDPEAQWKRAWDGRWRLVLFDVPVSRNGQREKLRRYLRSHGFGCLQGSVWISPDPLAETRTILAGGKVDVGSLLLLEAKACAGERDPEIVAGAWDFECINSLYERYLGILELRPTAPLIDAGAAQALQRWAAQERQAWFAIMGIDPLLPECLLPPGYLGQSVWQARRGALLQAGQLLRTFQN